MPEWNEIGDFKNGMENNLPYFHTSFILDFAHGEMAFIEKYIRIVITENMWNRLAANHLSTN